MLIHFRVPISMHTMNNIVNWLATCKLRKEVNPANFN